jgi:virulence-associated protein VagC
MGIYNSEEDGKYVIVPSNLESFSDSVVVLHFIALAIKLKYAVHLGTTVLEPFKETREIKFFWSSFFATLRDWTPADRKVSFKGTSDTQLGVNGAKLALWKASPAFKQGYQAFLPKGSCLIGKDEREPLTHYSRLSCTIGAKVSQEGALAALRTLILEYARARTSDWDDIDYEIPLGVALEGIHRTKKIKERGREKVTTLHPRRPSERIEIFSEGEKLLIRPHETPFDHYEELLKPYQEAQKVSIKDVLELRLKAKRIINNAWEVVQNYTAPLTKRRTVAFTYISKKGKGGIALTRSSWDGLLETVRDKADHSDKSLFSPLEIERKSGVISIDAIVEREKALKGLLPLSKLKASEWATHPAWVSYFTHFGTPTRTYASYYQPLRPSEEDSHGLFNIPGESLPFGSDS